MDAGQALATIRQYAVAGRLVYTTHARQRMQQRDVRAEDVRHALMNAARCTKQAEAGKWKAEGRDRDGDDLAVVVVIDAGLLIITVY